MFILYTIVKKPFRLVVHTRVWTTRRKGFFTIVYKINIGILESNDAFLKNHHFSLGNMHNSMWRVTVFHMCHFKGSCFCMFCMGVCLLLGLVIPLLSLVFLLLSLVFRYVLLWVSVYCLA